MKIYLLKNFNNYYNRIIQKYDSINEYTSNYEYAVRGYNNELKSLESGSQFNFNINDGIYSEVTYNYDPNQEFQPDYAIITDNDNNIKYRYFVIEAKRIRKGQYKLILKRDIVADTYDYTIQSPIYFERAMLRKNNPLIFKNENNSYNQIKKDEYLLKDKSKCAWIVGYYTRPNYNEKGVSTTGEVDQDYSISLSANYDYSTDADIGNFLSTTMGVQKDMVKVILDKNAFTAYFEACGQNVRTIRNKYAINNDTANVSVSSFLAGTSCKYVEKYTEADNKEILLNKSNEYSLFNYIINYYKKYIEKNEPNTYAKYSFTSSDGNLNLYDNKIVKTTVNGVTQYYRLKVNTIYSTYKIPEVINIKSPSDTANIDYFIYLKSAFTNVANNTFRINAETGTNWGLSLAQTDYLKGYYVSYDEVFQDQYKTTVSKDRPIVSNIPYSMFCMPYPTDDDIYVKTTDGNSFKVEARASIAMATALSLNSKCYDVQLLPYCPIQGCINNSGNNIEIDINYFTDTAYYKMIEHIYQGENLGNSSILMWATEGSFSFDIYKNLSVKDDDIDFKIQDETEFYRLNSPNYNGTYEFKATRNNGVEYFNVDCSYKPYTPYIHINPNYKHMYGSDFNDARGLICQGDFSLTQITDQWQEYIVNNKTYQAQFDRQIENMDVSNNIANEQAKWSIAVGTIQGASTGAFIGNNTGTGGVGTAVGAVVGGAASLVGGIEDLKYQKQLQKENKSYATDIFNLNNEAIKARPYTLNKVDSFNYNNKIYPFLERYDCTDSEKDLLRTQLKYNSMSVNLISTISSLQHTDKTFMKGKLIKYISNESNDNNFVLDLAEELNKGVFI